MLKSPLEVASTHLSLKESRICGVAKILGHFGSHCINRFNDVARRFRIVASIRAEVARGFVCA